MIFYLLLFLGNNFILDTSAISNFTHYKWRPGSKFYSSGPGNYVHYTWPPGHSDAQGMRVHHIWTTLPKPTETHGNAIFASTQQWYSTGPGGYMGTQAWRNRQGKMEYRALFSCWDADKDTRTGWVDEPDGHCERFGGEGTGSHCIIPYTLKEDTEYVVRLFFNGSNSTGAFWKGTITDMSNRVTTNIGTLYYPNYKGNVGYGFMKIGAADFQEWFLADGCENQAIGGVGLVGPYIELRDGTAITPKQATGSYVSGCHYEDVTGKIPGHSSGSPSIYMVGGGVTKQSVPANTPLW